MDIYFILWVTIQYYLIDFVAQIEKCFVILNLYLKVRYDLENIIIFLSSLPYNKMLGTYDLNSKYYLVNLSINFKYVLNHFQMSSVMFHDGLQMHKAASGPIILLGK